MPLAVLQDNHVAVDAAKTALRAAFDVTKLNQMEKPRL